MRRSSVAPRVQAAQDPTERQIEWQVAPGGLSQAGGWELVAGVPRWLARVSSRWRWRAYSARSRSPPAGEACAPRRTWRMPQVREQFYLFDQRVPCVALLVPRILEGCIRALVVLGPTRTYIVCCR